MFITIAVIGACEGCRVGSRPARGWADWPALAILVLAEHAVAVVIHALCPWCLTLMFSTTIQFMALSHATVAVQGIAVT